MRISKIVCDRCGKEIKEHPIRIFPEVVDRESGDILVGTVRASWDGSLLNYDFCDECTEEIIQFAKVKPADQVLIVKEPTENEMADIAEAMKMAPIMVPEAEEPKVEESQPVTTCGYGLKEKKPTIKDLVLQGLSKQEVCRITGCKPLTYDQTKYQLKKKGLLPKAEDDVEPVKCSEVHGKCIYADPKDLQCDYIGATGKRRGCPAEACTKFEKK